MFFVMRENKVLFIELKYLAQERDILLMGQVWSEFIKLLCDQSRINHLVEQIRLQL